MEDILTIVGSTVLVFTVTQILTWVLNKFKARRKRKRKERSRAVLR